MPTRIAIIGFGKIAQDQHVPSIKANPDFTLAAVASQRGVGGEHTERVFTDHREMLKAMPEIEAVAICTPPGPRHAVARDCLAAGRHVLLEKPPAATLSELIDLEDAARKAGRVLFATWHSRYAAAVERAREVLAGQQVTRLHVFWKEDVRRWHPGQAWIWEPSGFGIFDPGINALSIVTRIMPAPVFIAEATLSYPANRAAPIAAELRFAGIDGAEMAAELDWRQTGEQQWNIAIDTAAGRAIRLSKGGSRLEVDGKVLVDEKPDEYGGIYARFAELLRTNQSDVDASPFRLVADAFMTGRRVVVDKFDD